MKISRTLVAIAALTAFSAVQAADFDVYALNNSSGGGIGLSTISLTLGEAFTVNVAPTDLWSAGALPRWSNANGLTGNLLATGSDESGQVAGTLIGTNFGLYSQGNLSAPFGTLVGQIDNGNYFAIGTAYSGVAATAGTLKLLYWDSNAGDNSDHITAHISAVPEPDTSALMLAGLAAVGFIARRRKA